MRKIVLVLMLLILVGNCYATNRYVSTTGNDNNSGLTPAVPYLTVNKATTTAINPGDTIICTAGTFNPGNLQLILRAGVSLKGVGNFTGGTRINLIFSVTGSNGFNNGAFQLASTIENTNGNQTISGIWFDGSNYACLSGFLVRARGNVTFSLCKFTNFGIDAINFNGKLGETTGTPPSVAFSANNSVLNCSFIDCNDRIKQAANSVSAGSICLAGQRNILFQFDTLSNATNTLGITHNGNLFGAVQGNNIGAKWLNCIFTKPPDTGNQFNFGIESWYDQGGCQYRNNTYTGGGNAIDIGYGGANKGDSTYSWLIRNNLFTNPALLTSSGTQPVLSIAVQLEPSKNVTPSCPCSSLPLNAEIGDAIIDSNYLKNIGTLCQITLNNFAGNFCDNIYINHNVGESMGYANNTYSGVFNFVIGLGTRIDSIFIDNNTIVGSHTGTITGGTATVGAPKAILILQPDVGAITDIYFRNNIALFGSGYGYLLFRGLNATNRVKSQNNITFQNASTNNPVTLLTAVGSGNFVVGKQYTIANIGTTNFVAQQGASSNTVGVVFTAIAAGTGTGSATAVITPLNFTNTGNLKVNPVFVNGSTPVDYHLATGSPGIGGGLNPPATYIGAYPAGSTNTAPTANAGIDQTIQLPINSVTLVGSGNDPDGTIVTYAWTKVSGTGGTITSPSSASTTITGLSAGTYQYKLTVTDNGGLQGSDNVVIIVSPANIPPTANAGTDQAIQLPISSTTLTGTGNDPDGTITAYAWTRISGPNTPAIVSPTTASTSVTGLIAGTYVFRLTVTDNQSLTGFDEVQVIVSASPNVAPTANAGIDQTIQLPVNSVNLVGSGNDPDGSIVSYLWTQIAGATATITSPATASTSVTGLNTTGIYQFKLTVTDNGGLTGSDNILITVTAANIPPTVNAGTDQSITLPTNSITFNGSASDPDGSISSHIWTKISGTGGTITTPSSYTSTVTGLSAGTYVFRLTATDNQSLTGFDEMTVIVNAALPVPPVANAGPDQVITIPTTSVTLSGSGTDADGTIVGYGWTKVSGGAATITNPSSASTTVTGLDAGIYLFQLAVLDNVGLTGLDTVQITVNKGAATLSYSAPSLTVTFNGLPQAPIIITNPVGLGTISTTFDGIGTTPSAANSYAIVSGLSNSNWNATPITGTFTINKQPVVIQVTNTIQQYDSTLKNVSSSTIPSGLSTIITGGPQRYKGTYAIHVVLNEANYTAPNVDTTLTITPGQTSVSWIPANLTYPTVTGVSQTNATSPKDGVYTYLPPIGTLLNAGATVPLQLNFVPSDTNIAPIIGLTRNISVNKGVTSITTSDTVQFADGSPKFISAIAGQSGTVLVTYSGSHTAPGDYPFIATFTSGNWTAPIVFGTLHILSNPASIFITNNTDRVYNNGLPINVTVTSLYPYSLTYDGSVTPPTTVNPNIEVIATIIDGIHIGADTVTMNIIKADPPYNWPTITPITNPTPLNSTQLSITSTIPISVVYNPISGTVLPAGTHTLAGRITPTDVSNYNIIDVTNTIVVNAGSAVINVSNTSQTFNNLPHPITVSTIPANLDSIAILYGVTPTPPTDAGSYLFTVRLINPNVTAIPVSGVLIIAQATPVLSWTVPLPIQFGTALSSVQLNATSNIAGTFSYNYPIGYLLPAGVTAVTATFIPTSSNYKTVTISVPINVYGTPFLNYFLSHGNTNYINLPGQTPNLQP